MSSKEYWFVCDFERQDGDVAYYGPFPDSSKAQEFRKWVAKEIALRTTSTYEEACDNLFVEMLIPSKEFNADVYKENSK